MENTYSHRFVISGGPHSGKTTLVQGLASYGFAVVPEAAREIIAEQQTLEAQGERATLPWTDLVAFQLLVLERQLDLEARVNGEPTVLDRSVIDNIAYCHVFDAKPPARLVREVERRIAEGVYHSQVHILSPLPYAQDAQRKEDPELAARICAALPQTYKDFGFNVEEIPVLPIEERNEYVAQRLNELYSH